MEMINKRRVLRIAIIISVSTFIAYYRSGSAEQSSSKKSATTEFKDGDIIFQTTTSRQCKAVQAATHSKYSHCGIIFIDNGQTMVYEAVQPVRITPFKEWTQHGSGNHYVVKRLKNVTPLTTEVADKMRKEGQGMMGKNYDIYFGWGDDKIYCSELVWKIYERGAGIKVCPLKKLKDFDLSSPVVKAIMDERYGKDVPYEEQVVSPADLFESEQLVLVKEE